MLEIYVVTHSWQYDESSGDSELAYFIDPGTAEIYRQKYILHWQNKTDANDPDDYNIPDSGNTKVRKREVYGYGELPPIGEAVKIPVDKFLETLAKEKGFILQDTPAEPRKIVHSTNQMQVGFKPKEEPDNDWEIPF